jgi:hypothetical protein
MVTVKRELPIESVLPADASQHDFDHYGVTPLVGLVAPPLVRPQVPWWTPQIKPAPGPQEDYEFEFQVRPPVWPPSPGGQVKSPNRTIPTTLDLYEMQLKLFETGYSANQNVWFPHPDLENVLC